MEIQNLNLFPTLLRVVNDFVTPQECNDIINSVDRSTFLPNKYALVGESLSSHNPNSNILDYVEQNVPSCRYLRDRFNAALKDYTDYQKINRVKVSNSWMNIQFPGSKLVKHGHPGSAVSGILYLKADDKSNNIYFYNPNPYVLLMGIERYYTEYTFEHFFIKPVAGTLLLFPSWLLHGSNDEVNESEERIMMSINTVIV